MRGWKEIRTISSINIGKKEQNYEPHSKAEKNHETHNVCETDLQSLITQTDENSLASRRVNSYFFSIMFLTSHFGVDQRVSSYYSDIFVADICFDCVCSIFNFSCPFHCYTQCNFRHLH